MSTAYTRYEMALEDEVRHVIAKVFFGGYLPSDVATSNELYRFTQILARHGAAFQGDAKL